MAICHRRIASSDIALSGPLVRYSAVCKGGSVPLATWYFDARGGQKLSNVNILLLSGCCQDLAAVDLHIVELHHHLEDLPY